MHGTFFSDFPGFPELVETLYYGSYWEEEFDSNECGLEFSDSSALK